MRHSFQEHVIYSSSFTLPLPPFKDVALLSRRMKKEGYSVVCLKETTHLHTHTYKQQTKSGVGTVFIFFCTAAAIGAFRKKMNVLYTRVSLCKHVIIQCVPIWGFCVCDCVCVKEHHLNVVVDAMYVPLLQQCYMQSMYVPRSRLFLLVHAAVNAWVGGSSISSMCAQHLMCVTDTWH